jgi:hypothetical protein
MITGKNASVDSVLKEIVIKLVHIFSIVALSGYLTQN